MLMHSRSLVPRPRPRSRGIMVLRAPPLSYENNVFTLPFPLSLWEASLGMVGLCALMLIVVMHAERVMLQQGEAHDALHSSSDAILLAIAAVCQQGSPVETRGVPGRIIALLLFLLVLLLYTCYSASIVVLMQRTSTSIRHFRDLMDSQVTVGAVDVPYVWHYMKVEDDPVRQRIFKEKMLGNGKKKHIYTLAEGIRKVRSEYFCFLGIKNHIYAEISSTWQEHEKCGLVTIGADFIRVSNPHLTITRGSHRVDAYKIMIRRLSERGIWHRMQRRFVREKPRCVNADAVFHSVSLTDCRGAFYMFLVTLAASVLVFLLELVAHRRQQRARRVRDARQDAAFVAVPRRGPFIGGLQHAPGGPAGPDLRALWSGKHELIM
ncbi:Ionotropic receptor 75a [Frankliniella fusca]|uniref:Ionotropic receptor 75a n=1 Tax=Frankliniella fusca TaxID=407009 RepID=A0AAE1LF24_9NEOP|nr:Ionotropic receptor 75a [Frankliniella fusca]